MGFGPFSSESTTKLETVSTAFNTGFSEIEGPATSINFQLGSRTKVGKGGTLSPVINLTDQGAIAAAQAISEKSIRSIEQFGNSLPQLFSDLVSTLGQSGKATIDAVTAANKVGIAAVSEANRTELENLGLAAIKWGALALAGYFAIKAFAEFK